MSMCLCRFVYVSIPINTHNVYTQMHVDIDMSILWLYSIHTWTLGGSLMTDYTYSEPQKVGTWL